MFFQYLLAVHQSSCVTGQCLVFQLAELVSSSKMQVGSALKLLYHFFSKAVVLQCCALPLPRSRMALLVLSTGCSHPGGEVWGWVAPSLHSGINQASWGGYQELVGDKCNKTVLS